MSYDGQKKRPSKVETRQKTVFVRPEETDEEEEAEAEDEEVSDPTYRTEYEIDEVNIR